MINISKKKYKTLKLKTCEVFDDYWIYKATKKEFSSYLNTWFYLDNRNEYICLKKVDKETSLHLHRKKFNHISIFIYDSKSLSMKVHLHSCDDSSYGIWFENKDLETYQILRLEIMEYISSKKVINGDELMNYCIEKGADKDSIDYN